MHAKSAYPKHYMPNLVDSGCQFRPKKILRMVLQLMPLGLWHPCTDKIRTSDALRRDTITQLDLLPLPYCAQRMMSLTLLARNPLSQKQFHEVIDKHHPASEILNHVYVQNVQESFNDAKVRRQKNLVRRSRPLMQNLRSGHDFAPPQDCHSRRRVADRTWTLALSRQSRGAITTTYAYASPLAL